MQPLKGLTVLEFSQFMAGPSAGLRLADLGARVIKIERPKTGEAGRNIATKNMYMDGSSLVFHTANRNKESYSADLKNPSDLQKIRALIAQADVMTHNFRPGVMEKIGLDYETVNAINSKMIYGTITGYGTKGPWVKKPGQDLLIQSLSGLTHLSGNADDAPTPFGVAVADMICGTHFVQGILAALVRRNKTKLGAWVEVSLMESVLDLQFEVLTTYLNDGKKLPQRAKVNNAHAYLQAPYGVYKTADGHIALAMGSLTKLGQLLGCDALAAFQEPTSWFSQRDDIMTILKDFLVQKTSSEWLEMLEPHDIWCAEVLHYERLLSSEVFRLLEMDQYIPLQNGEVFHTTRCPIKFNEQPIFSPKPAPRVGEHTDSINLEFNLL